MKTNGRQLGTQGNAIRWVLLIVLLASVVSVVVWKVSRKPAPKPVAVATPPPATPVPATPEPVIVKATPTPAPIVVAATPAPTPPPATPPPLDFPTVARNPSLWPAQVSLLTATAFPISMNGRVVGQAQAPVGTVMRVLRIVNQHAEVEFQNAKHFVPVASTDLMQRALVTFRNHGSVVPQQTVAAAPQATPPPATPALGGTALTDRPQVGVTVERKKNETVRGGPAGGGDLSKGAEKCVFNIKVQSKSFGDLPKLSAEYLIFVERQKIGEKKGTENVERVTGSKTIEALTKKVPTQVVTTDEIELRKQNLVGGWTYANGGRIKAEDNVMGVWVKVMYDGKLVAEYANPSTITKRGWEQK